MILLNPGPVNLSDRVRKALLKPDLCHREREFSLLQKTIREKLLQVYNLDRDRWTAILLTGSGTAAMEATIATLIPGDGKLLVIENGVYGERISKIAQIYNIPYLSFHHDWGAEIDRSQLESLIQKNRDLTHLAVVHHETTTGRLNNLQEIGFLCQQYDLKMLVDGVSSFGAEELDFDSWGITACAATANKCLHGVPGTSFAIVRRDVLPSLNQKPRTLYLNLLSYYQQQEQGGTPFTQSVQTFYALAEALQELADEGGWRQRRERYTQSIDFVRQNLIDLGIKPLLPENSSSIVLNAFYLPENVSYQKLHDRLKEKGFVIYAGQGNLAKSIFRVSCMGAITDDHLKNFLAAIAQITVH